MMLSINTTTNLSLVSQDTQWMMLLSFVVIIAGTIALYKWMNENGKANRKVSIKIDKNGKYHYHADEQAGNGKLLFWVKVIFIIIAGILALIPFKEFFIKD